MRKGTKKNKNNNNYITIKSERKNEAKRQTNKKKKKTQTKEVPIRDIYSLTRRRKTNKKVRGSGSGVESNALKRVLEVLYDATEGRTRRREERTES